MSYDEGVYKAVKTLPGTIFTVGLIVFIAVSRLSRFDPIQGHWEPIKIELPFKFRFVNPTGFTDSSFSFSIKGNSSNSAKVNFFMHDNFVLHPVQLDKTGPSRLQRARLAYMEAFTKFEDGERAHWVKVYEGNQNTVFEYCVMVNKVKGVQETKDGDPIVAVLRVGSEINLKTKEIPMARTQFLDWCMVKPFKK